VVALIIINLLILAIIGVLWYFNKYISFEHAKQKFAEYPTWIKSLSLVNLVIFGAGVLFTIISTLGYFFFYADWTRHLSWVRSESFDSYSTDIKDWVMSLMRTVEAGLSFSLLYVIAFIVTGFCYFFVTKDRIWRICLAISTFFCAFCILIGIVAAAKSGKTEKGVPYCAVVEYNIHERYQTNEARYCSKSNGPNVTMFVFMIIGLALDVVAYYFIFGSFLASFKDDESYQHQNDSDKDNEKDVEKADTNDQKPKEVNEGLNSQNIEIYP